jgi:hypothetical protein
MKRLRGKLTYSNVMVTVLAVLVVGGGTAYAATEMLPKGSVGTKQIQKEAVTPSKLSKTSKAALTGPAGPKGASGATGAQGPQGPQGAPGQTGAAGSALAYATISATGEVSDAKNISQSNVVHAGGSLLCISGLSFTPHNAVASSIFGSSQTLVTSVSLHELGACAAGTQVEIATYSTTAGPTPGAVSVLIN